jgi:hypothetical protein
MGSKIHIPEDPRLEPAPEYPRPERLEYYRELYTKYHDDHAKFLAGKVSVEHVKGIARMVYRWRERVRTRYPRILDYGSGKGFQYLTKRIHEKWGGILPHCYDLGVFHLAKRPEGRFDIILCTDVMEHLEAEDVPDVLADLRAYTGDRRPASIYLNICCRLAWKKFDDGSNLHKTVEEPDWWEQKIEEAFDGSKIRVERSYVIQVEEPADEHAPDGEGDVPPEGGHSLPSGSGESTGAGRTGDVPAQEDQRSAPSRQEEGSSG